MPLSSEWSHFVKRITLDTSVQTVYECWATQAGLEFWFLRQAKFLSKSGNSRERREYVRSGDKYHWVWYGHADDVFEKREIIEANGKDFIKFEFSAGCTVSVNIGREFGTTVCELRQEQIPLDEDPKLNLYIGCLGGWTFYLSNLKSLLEGGVDLRNKDVRIQQLINS